ncbi:hypothetical protein NDU88_005273 [Pleurodeles waltl]|uniref:Uncharacterized protein n=1 Tax=Pleurodeles waltl TaxID=8319 RepID=A0AAV7W7K9_PLEWA|nr:hypothetical protein NDU88_005273 [Pleurodeles waltl]
MFKNCPSSYAFKAKAAEYENKLPTPRPRRLSWDDEIREAEEEELNRLGLEERIDFTTGASALYKKSERDVIVNPDKVSLTDGEGVATHIPEQLPDSKVEGFLEPQDKSVSMKLNDAPVSAIYVAEELQSTPDKQPGSKEQMFHSQSMVQQDAIALPKNSRVYRHEPVTIPEPTTHPLRPSCEPEVLRSDAHTRDADNFLVSPELFPQHSDENIAKEKISSNLGSCFINKGKPPLAPGDPFANTDYACKAVELSAASFSDSVVAQMMINWDTEDDIPAEEIEVAMDFSTSLKRKESEYDDAEASGVEFNG